MSCCQLHTSFPLPVVMLTDHASLVDSRPPPVVAVGAGTAGSVVASRLSEDPFVTVLLLEAGGSENIISDIPLAYQALQGTPVDWQYKTVPQEASCFGLREKRSKWPRGKVLGGSSTINAMVYTRGARSDYDNWVRDGAIGWSWEEVFPYFLKSEDNRDPSIAYNGMLRCCDRRSLTALMEEARCSGR